jgi:hypothetical protein
MRGVRLIALVVTSIGLGVSSGALGAPAVQPNGIRGIVLRSPTKPVCEAGVSCSAPAAGVVLLFTRADRVVARTKTRPNGSFRVALSPGAYVVRTFRKLPFGGAQPRSVRVAPGRFTVVRIVVDTGIRSGLDASPLGGGRIG